MHRVFDLDVLACAPCGGRLRVVATVQDRLAMRAILAHLDRSLAPEPPGPAPPTPAAIASTHRADHLLGFPSDPSAAEPAAGRHDPALTARPGGSSIAASQSGAGGADALRSPSPGGRSRGCAGVGQGGWPTRSRGDDSGEGVCRGYAP